MAREKVYRASWVNRARWKVELEIWPAGNAALSVDTVDVVEIPKEVIGIFSPGVLDAKFATGLPIGTIDVSTLTVGVELAPLEEAEEFGFENASDLRDLADYLIEPTYSGGGSFTSGGITGRSFDTRNFVRILVSEGPFTQKRILFEGVQEDVGEDQLILGENNNFGINIQLRSWWRVALEEIQASDVWTRFFDSGSSLTPAVTSRVSFELIGTSGGDRFARVVRFRVGDFVTYGAGSSAERYEHVDYYTVEEFWREVGALCSLFYAAHRRVSGATTYLKSSGKASDATPFDNVTLYKQTTTDVTGARSTALAGTDKMLVPMRSYLRARSSTLAYAAAYTTYDPAAPIDETGGFLSSRGNFGAGTMKSIWDVLQQSAEQAMVKVVPSYALDDVTLSFRKVFENHLSDGDRFSEGAYTILRREIQGIKTVGKRTSGNTTESNRIYDLRDEYVGEAEAGMQEGDGDDKKTVSYRLIGTEQADGMDVPMMLHNLPRLGSSERDYYRYPKPDNRITDAVWFAKTDGDVVLFHDAASWEACLYYADTLSGWTGRTEPIRVHENVKIDLGNSITPLDSTTVPLSTETNPERYKEETRVGVIETIQSTTGWPYWVAKLYVDYLSSDKQGSLKMEIPGEHGLPEYLGEWFDIADNDGNSKGLNVWRDTARLDPFPKKFALVETSLEFAITGTAQVRLWASPYAEGA